MKKSILLLFLPLLFISCGSSQDDAERIRECSNPGFVQSHARECSEIFTRFSLACSDGTNFSQECRDFNTLEFTIRDNLSLAGISAVVAGDASGGFNDVVVNSASLDSISFSVNGEEFSGRLTNGARLSRTGFSSETASFGGGPIAPVGQFNPRVRCSGDIFRCTININGLSVVVRELTIVGADTNCGTINNVSSPCSKIDSLKEGYALIVTTGDTVRFASLGGGQFNRINAVYTPERGGFSRRTLGDDFTIFNIEFFADTIINQVAMRFDGRYLNIRGFYNGASQRRVEIELELEE